MPMVLRFVGDSNQTPALTINTLTATISNRHPQAGGGEQITLIRHTVRIRAWSLCCSRPGKAVPPPW